MHKAISMFRNLAIGLVLWTTAGAGLAFDLNLTNSVIGFHNPIGIDFQDTSGKLILSVNYSDGLPNNLELADPTNGSFVTFASSLAGLTNEVKVATVRTGACQGGFTAGESFTGNGVAGQIVRISADGLTVLNPWVTLPGESALVRGSLFQDRFCAAGGDLIVVTGNEQDGTCPNDCRGNVWRVTSAGVATKVATIGTHLEGVETIPNDPSVYGPLAGRIIAGAEQFIIPGGPPTYDPNGGKIYAVDPAKPGGVDTWFTISAGIPATCTPGLATPNLCNYRTANAFHPEDLDIIRAHAQFFGVAFRDGEVLTAQASDFVNRCGQVFITQEFPFGGTSGLSAMRWDGGANNFVVDPLSANLSIQQWEHVTFTSGQDCFGLKVVKTPDKGDAGSTFTQGSQVTFQIVVTNTGANADDISLTDALPGNGGLVWASASPTQGSCTNPIVGNNLSCNLGTVAAGASVTITVTSTATTPIAACQDQPNPAAIATDTHGNRAQDDGFLTCTPQAPPQLKVVKTPKAGTFTQGGQTSYTIVVSNPAPAGSSSATNVTLTDQLPGNGGLVWSNVSINPAQGSCTIVSNLLSCNLGTIAAGGSVTVTVTSAATTPAAACQDQPNDGTLGATNLAKATADGGLSAQDIGKLTCTPPAGGLIAPTQTTCQQFAAGTASTLGQINYSVSNGKIGQGINPGVFFYYAKITTTVPNQVVTVSQSNTSTNNAALFQVQQSQDRLYKGDCSSYTTGTLISGSTGASFTVATPGTYIISIKYSTKSIAGKTAPVPADITYNFTTSLGGSTGASVLLHKQ